MEPFDIKRKLTVISKEGIEKHHKVVKRKKEKSSTIFKPQIVK